MKNSLGKRLLYLFIFFNITLSFGDGFDYNITVDKTNPYVKEPVILTMDIEQTDTSKVILFHFGLLKSDDYYFVRLNVSEQDVYKKAKIRITYLVYPLKPGKIDIAFELIKKVTTSENVAFSAVGERDNVKIIPTQDTAMSLAPLELDVKPLPEGTVLVGNYTLEHSFKTHNAKAYEPIPVMLTLKGEGYPLSKDFRPIPQSEHYTLFEEKPRLDKFNTEKGMHITARYPLALSANKNFNLPEVAIKAFDPTKEQSYMLSIPEQSFSIQSPAQQTLVDKTDSPAPLKPTDWSWMGTLFGYIVVFIAGFLTAKSVQWQKRVQHKTDPFSVQIAQTNDPKVLLALLMAEDCKKYSTAIEMLEAHLYEGKKINLNELKRELHA